MKKTVLKLSCLLALLGVPAAQAATTLYDVRFSSQLSSATSQTGPAVIGTAGDYWNLMTNATGSASLLDSGGNTTGVSLAWSADGIYQYRSTFGGGNAPLMSGYIYASSAHGVSFSGLPAGQPCTLYIYSQADGPGNRRLSVTVNGTTYTTTPSAFPTYFIAGQNYLAITGVTDGSGNLDLSYNVAAGEANLNGIQLIMDSPALSITTQPSSQVAAVGGSVSLSVTAEGAVPLSFQWFKNGGVVSGATNSTLTRAGAGVADSGVYTVAVTNAEGLVISQPVTVAVGAPQLLTWGYNSHGQLGDGTTANRSNAVSVASHVVAAAAGGYHSLFVKDDGALWAMGNNDHGQLGDGTAINRRNAVSVASNVVALAAGSFFSLFVKDDGTLWGMGQNSYGELGDGTCTYSRSNAVSVASNVVALAAGAHHSLFLKGDGTLWAMGSNIYGALGDETASARSNAVPVASHVMALAAGSYHSLYLKGDGTLWAMGYNQYGQLGDGTTNNRARAVCTASNVTALAAGTSHSLYLKGDGTLWAMGQNTYGQLGDGTTNNRTRAVCTASNVTALAAGGLHSLYLKDDGTLWAMGWNYFGQLGDGTTAYQRPWPVSVPGMSLASVVSGSPAYQTLAVGQPLPPMITNPPTNLTVVVGCPVTFEVTASGASPLMYQWQFNGTSLDGATNAIYTITSAALSDGGSYAVIVTDNHGSTVSATATLTVSPLPPPMATVTAAANPAEAGSVTGGGLYVVGSNAVLTATATNGWRFTGWNGATNNPYVVTVPATNSTFTAAFAATAVITAGASPSAGGSVSGSGTYLVGSTNWITAAASNGWAFTGWSDGVAANPRAIVVASDWSCTADFAPAATVTAAANPAEAGSVTGGGLYVVGSNAVLTATATNGWRFAGWNNGMTNNPYVVTVPATNSTFTADFAATAVITAGASPSAGGSVSGSGTYLVGSTNWITAAASNGWAFTGWSDGVAANPRAVVVASDWSCTANFAPAATVTAAANPAEAGSVTGGGLYLVGSNAVLTATATNGWRFTGWDNGTTNNPYVVTVPATNSTFTAAFAATAVITAGANPSAGGSVSGGGTYLVGSTNLLTATAAVGWLFTGWNDGATRNPYGIVVTADLTYTANFAPAATVDIVINPLDAGGLVTGGGVYPVGSNVVLTATPVSPTPTGSNRWMFLNWNGTVTNYTKTGNTSNPWGFTVTTDITATANFAQVTSNGFVYTYIWVKAMSPVNKTGIRLMGETMNLGIAIVGYVGTATHIIIPSHIDGVPVNQIATGALTEKSLDYVGFESDFGDTDSVTTFERASIAAAVVDFGMVIGLSSLIVGGEVGLSAGALYGGEILVPAGLAAFAMAMITLAEQDFANTYGGVWTLSDPVGGGHTSGDGIHKRAEPVLITASANSGWRFDGWSDGGAASHWVWPTVWVTANFVKLSNVTVIAEPEDGGTVSGGGTFDVGSEIKITATPSEYWKFMEWNDGDTSATRTITVPASDVTYTATFEELKLEVEVEAGPNIIIDGLTPGRAAGGGEYGLNEVVTLAAFPVLPKWKFNKWVLKDLAPSLHLLTNCIPVAPVWVFAVTRDMLGLKLSVDADFSTDVEVKVAANPPYAGRVEGEGGHEWPPVLQDLPFVTAFPAAGWAFTGWSTPVTATNTNNPYCPILGMVTPIDFTVTANFTPTCLTIFVDGESVALDWPTRQKGWPLQTSTNGLRSANWLDRPGSGDTNSLVAPIDRASPAVFYRLRQP